MRLTAADEVAQGRATIAQDWVALYKALGGGWKDDGRKDDGRKEPAL
jgi:outer membrane protein TolC